MALRRAEYIVGTAADWAKTNPVVDSGLLCVETPAQAIKIGDGVHRYSALEFVTTGTGEYDEIDGGTP